MILKYKKLLKIILLNLGSHLHELLPVLRLLLWFGSDWAFVVALPRVRIFEAVLMYA